MHQLSGDKNVMKPSRILFNGIGDGDLPGLACRLYSVAKGGEGAPAKELPEAWRLKLPFPPPGTVFREKMSPTALDQYARCPFNFYLQEVFGVHSDDRSQELDAMAFGNLCHGVLESFAVDGPKDSSDAAEIAAYLAGEVRRRLEAFGKIPPAVIALQGEAAIERLNAFAVLQAARRRDGWRIVASERKLECRIKACPTFLRGKVDRIDVDDAGRAIIIDYKGSVKPEHDIAGKDPAHPGKVQARIYAQMVRRALGLDVVGTLYVSYGKNHAVAGAVDSRAVEAAHVPGARKGALWCMAAEPDPAVEASERPYSSYDFTDMLDATERLVEEAVSRMERGEVAPNPVSKDACRYCPAAQCPKKGV
jgi:CRISPR/Cas system-associated exonuclease Cas4 (RecB family)